MSSREPHRIDTGNEVWQCQVVLSQPTLAFDACHSAQHTCGLHRTRLPTANNHMSKKTRAADSPDFEKSLIELEQIVERMEQGELSLDESLKQFERGVALTRSCQTALQQAEQKVEILLRKSGSDAANLDPEPEPFDVDDEA
jgi:exodeoxyribonuclease VII small subunit